MDQSLAAGYQIPLDMTEKKTGNPFVLREEAVSLEVGRCRLTPA